MARRFFASAQTVRQPGDQPFHGLCALRPDERLLTTEELGALMGLDLDGVYRLVRQGLPRITLSARLYRFSPAAVDRWLALRNARESQFLKDIQKVG